MVHKVKCSPQGYNLGTTENQRGRVVFRRVEKGNRGGQTIKAKRKAVRSRCSVILPNNPS